MKSSHQSKKRKIRVLFHEILEIIKNDNIPQLLIWLNDGSIPDINMRSHDGNDNTLLILASQLGRIEVVRLLLKYGALTHKENESFHTAIAVACHEGHLDIARLLESKGADLHDEFILLTTCQNGHVEVVRFLLDHGADINSERDFCSTPLAAACRAGHFEIVKLLVTRGAEVNCEFPGDVEDYCSNPLAAACFANNLEIVKYLVSAGADASICAPLAYLHEENIELVSFLLDNGADINATSPYANPLIRASGSGLIGNVKCLLKRGANVHVREDKTTSLMFACVMTTYRRERILPTIKLLLDYGADTNDVDSEGDSALIHLLRTSRSDTAESDLECVRLLLQYGADVTATNLAGETASSLVEAGSAICNLLAEYRDQNDRELLAIKPLVK